MRHYVKVMALSRNIHRPLHPRHLSLDTRHESSVDLRGFDRCKQYSDIYCKQYSDSSTLPYYARWNFHHIAYIYPFLPDLEHVSRA